MSERRKQMHRERARLHQERLKKNKGLEELASITANVTSTESTEINVDSPIGPTSINSNQAISTSTIEEKKRIQVIDDRNIVAAWTTGMANKQNTNHCLPEHSATV